MITKLDKVALGLLRPINPFATLILGIFTATWGIMLLMPWRSFDSAKLFSKAAEFAPEWAWGTWATACGLFIIFAVFKGFYVILSKSLAFAIWHWVTVSGMLWWGDWTNMGGITYTFVGIYCIYCYMNIKINYVVNHEKTPSLYE